MCGRILLTSSGRELAEAFQLAEAPELSPRFNIAPSQDLATLTGANPERSFTLRRWGLVPSWAKDPSVGYRMINARSETAASKPAFRDALRRRRCIVPANGFYEWTRNGRERQPHWFHPRDEPFLAMAGLWERWTARESDDVIESVTVLTTEANASVNSVHDRMPVLLRRADFDRWLDPGEDDPEKLRGLLAPCPDDWLVSQLVGPRVNSPSNDDADCLLPPTEYQPSLF
jgi:putative SOS response-associated peptidase YedK